MNHCFNRPRSLVVRVASGSSSSSYTRALLRAYASSAVSSDYPADFKLTTLPGIRAYPLQINSESLETRPVNSRKPNNQNGRYARKKPNTLSLPPPMRAAELDWLQEDASISLIDGPEIQARNNLNQKSYQNRAKLPPSFQRLPRRVRPTQVYVKPDEPHGREIGLYQDRFRPLLKAEQAHDAQVTQERLRRPVEELRSEGYCLLGLSAFWLDATQFGLPVAVFSLGPGRAFTSHAFDNGSQVLISRKSPLEEEPLLGSVVGKTATQLRIVFDSRSDIETGLWRLDLASSDIAFIRMRAALDHLHFDPQHLTATSTPHHEPILLGTNLRDLLLKQFRAQDDKSPETTDPLTVAIDSNPSSSIHDSRPVTSDSRLATSVLFNDQRLYSWARRHQRPHPLTLDGDPEFDLNPSQVMAIACMLSNRLSLIQGPPGTGKSRTIVEAVKLLKKHFFTAVPLVVCTYTNMAVDNLVESFSSVGVDALRVGFAGRVPVHLHQYTLDAKIEVHSQKPELDRLRAAISTAERRLDSIETVLQGTETRDQQQTLQMKRDLLASKVGQLRRQKWGKEREMLTEIVSRADVICTTMITSACTALQVTDFPVVFIDEASMSTEPASLIPIMRGSQHVVLVGDHKQLPPVVTSAEALSGGLGISLFERLVGEGDTPLVMLEEQYRMHPGISNFPNTEFYDCKLKDGTIDASGQAVTGWTPPASSFLPLDPVTGRCPSAVFLDHSGMESRRGRSIVNSDEAEIVCLIIEDLLLKNPSLTGRDIGVIAPYTAQIQLLTSMLRENTVLRARLANVLGRHRVLEVPLIEIKTVDGFEGREKEVIIFSTVRSNSMGNIGFLADRRRLNVGLTRARRGLFVVGNTPTLLQGKVSAFRDLERVAQQKISSDGVWGRFVRYMQAQRSFTRFKDPRLPQMQ